MSKTLTEIAQQLSTPKKVQKTVPEKTKVIEEAKPVPKVQLIYAFNGTGKTRLSRAFKDLISPKPENDGDDQHSELAQKKVLYYSAFTEDLFYWDNDLKHDAVPKLKILPNAFTRWVLEEQGQDQNVTTHFTLLRNLYEKTASFLGYPKWSDLLPDNKEAYLNRIIQFTSHSTLSNEVVAEPTPQEKQTVKFLLDHLINNYGYWQQEGQDA